MNERDEPMTYIEGFLCRAWGETDLPEARLVRTREAWEAFIVEAQWGREAQYDKLQATDQEAVDAQVRYIVEDMADNGIGCIEFEIGGVSVERVTFLAEVEAARPFGCLLAMRVLQSDLYKQLEDDERAQCDELVQRNREWFKRDSRKPQSEGGA